MFLLWDVVFSPVLSQMDITPLGCVLEFMTDIDMVLYSLMQYLYSLYIQPHSEDIAR